MGQTITPDLAEGLGRDRPGGVIVGKIYPGGPADRAGLKTGDIILSVDGRPVQDVESFRFRVATRELGGTATLSVSRDGRTLSLKLPLEPAKETPPRDETRLEGEHPLAGAVVANLSPALAEELDLPGAWQGVIIIDIVRGSPAHRLRFQPGDILLTVNRAEVHDVRGLASQLARPERRWRITFLRKGQVHRFEFSL